MPDETFPTSPKLTSLLSERQFQAAVIVGLPGLVYGYVEAFQALFQGSPFDAAGVALALAANPITLYLAARQYPRGKAAEAIGVQLAPLPAPADPDQYGVSDDDVAGAQASVAVTMQPGATDAQVASVQEQLDSGAAGIVLPAGATMQMTGHTDDGALRFEPILPAGEELTDDQQVALDALNQARADLRVDPLPPGYVPTAAQVARWGSMETGA